jgi:ppGpp synthetase/RelA/SpoT-type nucleotidyltranferase
VGLIEDFIGRYRKEYDFYDQAPRLVAQILDSNLQASGIRSMVTSRAKTVGRLEAKVRQRASAKRYASVEGIYKDIIDLAGARVALYFPAERSRVDSIIKSLFLVVGKPKEFPADSSPLYHNRRFSGYSAIHYRVHLRETALSDAQKRYAEALIEIQVASVVMHAWAEVEHDLVYKPVQGTLSEDEYAILDQLNGLVIAGEIALERLQKAGEARVAAGERVFSNHYDLAAHLLDRVIFKGPAADTALGRIDLLFELLRQLALATPAKLRPYVDALHTDTERRPIAEQIIDQLLAEDDARYKTYEEIRATQPILGAGIRETLEPELHEAMGFFLSQWISFERTIRERVRGSNFSTVPTVRLLSRLGDLDAREREEVEWIRRIRNNVVHGIEIPDPASLREAGARIQAITARLAQEPPSLGLSTAPSTATSTSTQPIGAVQNS